MLHYNRQQQLFSHSNCTHTCHGAPASTAGLEISAGRQQAPDSPRGGRSKVGNEDNTTQAWATLMQNVKLYQKNKPQGFTILLFKR